MINPITDRDRREWHGDDNGESRTDATDDDASERGRTSAAGAESEGRTDADKGDGRRGGGEGGCGREDVHDQMKSGVHSSALWGVIRICG